MSAISGFPTVAGQTTASQFPAPQAPQPKAQTNKYASLLNKIALKSVKFNTNTGSLKSVKVRSVHASNLDGITLGDLGLSNLKCVKSAHLSNINLGSATFKSGFTSHGAYPTIQVCDLQIKSLKIHSGRIQSIHFPSHISNATIKSRKVAKETASCNYASLMKKIGLKSVKYNSHTGSLKSVKVRSVHASNNPGISLGDLHLSNLKGVKSAHLSNINLGSVVFKSGFTSHGAYKSIQVCDLEIKSLKVQSGRIKSIHFASHISNAEVVSNKPK